MAARIPLSDRIWENWITVEDLASQWKLSKRRCQQILKQLRESDEYQVHAIIGMHPDGYSIPLYRVEKL